MNRGVPHTTSLFVFFATLFVGSVAAAAWFELYYLLAIPFAALFFVAGWHTVNAVFFLLLFTLPFSVEFQVNASLGTDFPDELLMLLTAGIFFCYWLYRPSLIPKNTWRHPLIVLLGITFLWSAVVSAFSTHPLISFKFLLAKCWYIGAFVLAALIVFRDKAAMQKAALILSGALFAVVVISLVRHAGYGFTFAGTNPSLSPFFRNHVNYSAMLVCFIPLFVVFYQLSASRKTKRWLAAAIVILLIALFFSYARGAWLALITGMSAWWLISKRRMMAVYIVAICLVGAAVWWLQAGDRYLQYAHNYRTTIFHQNFREHLRATYEFRDMSTAERFYRWVAGVRMIEDSPLVGFGPSTFYYNYKPYAVPAFKTWVSDNPERSTVHNYFLLITLEQGIPALLFFLLLAGALLYYAQMLYHRAKDPFYKMTARCCGAIITMILTVNFLSDLVETDKVGSLFFLCLSALIITDIHTRKETAA